MIVAFIIGVVLLLVPAVFFVRAGMQQSKRAKFNFKLDCLNFPLLLSGGLLVLAGLTIIVRLAKGVAAGGLPGPLAIWIFVACLAASILTRWLPTVVNVFIQIAVSGVIILLAAAGANIDLGPAVDAIYNALLLSNSLFLTLLAYWGVNTWFTFQKANWPKFLSWVLATVLFFSVGVGGQRLRPEGSANAPMMAQYTRVAHAAQFDGEYVVVIPQRKADRHDGQIDYYKLMHPEISGEWSPLELRSGQRIVVSSDTTSIARAVRFKIEGGAAMQPLSTSAHAEYRVDREGVLYIGLPNTLKQTIRFGLRIYD